MVHCIAISLGGSRYRDETWVEKWTITQSKFCSTFTAKSKTSRLYDLGHVQEILEAPVVHFDVLHFVSECFRFASTSQDLYIYLIRYVACDRYQELESVVSNSPSQANALNAIFPSWRCAYLLVLLLWSSKHGTSTWPTKFLIKLGKLGTLTFGFYTGHTGAHWERQSGWTGLVLAELGTSECPLF